ncbi:hypothetical protein GHT06_011619 [Daphnia sinensis]|uniref:THAP-type domain-containing protein n=1 Tax=Daphnia sinensis TaxID=1820382 RepID=A0AAD5PY26_9CRUS|nr:hypothetical protein GHT06_011619 [Daphnia sinensis]
MTYCCVIGCKNSSKKRKVEQEGVGSSCKTSENKTRYFHPPKDEELFKRWSQKIPRKAGSKLLASSRVCDKHFMDHEIVKRDEFIIEGKVVFLPRINWKLKTNAIPSVFEDSTLQHLPAQKTRKEPMERKPLGKITNYKQHYRSAKKPRKRKEVAKISEKPDDLVPTQTIPLQLEEYKDVVPIDESDPGLSIEVVSEKDEILQSDIDKVKLPAPSWQRAQLPNSACFKYFELVVNDNSVSIQKIATVDYKKRTIRKTIMSRDVSENNIFFTSIMEVQEMLNKIHEAKICPGIIHNVDKHRKQENCFVSSGEFLDGVWRANKCTLLIQSRDAIKPCKFCKCVDKALKQQFKRHKTIRLNAKSNHKYLTKELLLQKISAQAKKESQLKYQLQKKNATINELNAQIKMLRDKTAI